MTLTSQRWVWWILLTSLFNIHQSYIRTSSKDTCKESINCIAKSLYSYQNPTQTGTEKSPCLGRQQWVHYEGQRDCMSWGNFGVFLFKTADLRTKTLSLACLTLTCYYSIVLIQSAIFHTKLIMHTGRSGRKEMMMNAYLTEIMQKNTASKLQQWGLTILSKPWCSI